MQVEWQFKNTSTDGMHANGFERWINAPAVDLRGAVYAKQRGWEPLPRSPKAGRSLGDIFLNQAIGAAYTPLSLGPDGTIYTENDGILFAVGK